MTLFNENTTVIDPVENQPDPEVLYENYLEKYKDEHGVAKALYHKDAFIEQLKAEQAGLRQELQARIKMEEFLDKLNSTNQDGLSNEPTQMDRETGTGQPAITAEDIDKLLEQRELNRKKQQNLQEVQNTLSQKLGPDYSSKVKATLSTLGISEQHAETLASDSPAAFFRLIGLDEKRSETFEAPPRSVFRPTGPASKQKDYNYYEQIRKTNPTLYWSPSIQNEMHRQAEALGDAFGHKQ